jgi:hypothetical protein
VVDLETINPGDIVAVADEFMVDSACDAIQSDQITYYRGHTFRVADPPTSGLYRGCVSVESNMAKGGICHVHQCRLIQLDADSPMVDDHCECSSTAVHRCDKYTHATRY